VRGGVTDSPAEASLRYPRLTRLISIIAQLRSSWVGLIGLGIILFWTLAALAAPWLAPFPPNATLVPFAPPGTVFEGGKTFLLGTDHLGRDILSRILYGARTVLVYTPLATGCAYVVGIIMGLTAGYKRGWVDALLSRISDLVGLDHGTGHLASMSPPKNQRLDTGKG
jgi:peptide/nickel transport system permease protein